MSAFQFMDYMGKLSETKLRQLSKQERSRTVLHTFTEMIQDIFARAPAEREMICLSFKNDIYAKLYGTAQGFAQGAIKYANPQYVIVGIQTLMLAAYSGDDEEVIIELSMLWHSAKKLRHDLRKTYNQHKHCVNAEIRSLFDAFFSSPRSLADVGYEEYYDEEGVFSYKAPAWRREVRLKIKE